MTEYWLKLDHSIRNIGAGVLYLLFTLRWGHFFWKREFSADLAQLAGDAHAHDGAHDVVLGMAAGQGLDDVPVVARHAIGQQLDDGGRGAVDHGVDVGRGQAAWRHGDLELGGGR